MATEVETPRAWAVAGSYFEACNCEAVCPCRRVAGTLHVDDAPLGWYLHGRCGFATDFSYQGTGDG